MAEKIEIKKELTEIELKQVLTAFQESIKTQLNVHDLGTTFQELIKKITPAKEVHLMIVLEPDKTLETVTLEKNITIDISSSRSILAKCTQTKGALFSNDIARDTDYNKEIDNFLDYPLKNILVVPLLNEDKEILGLIWAGIPQKDWNQYMQSDIEYIMQVSILNEKMILKGEGLHAETDQATSFSMAKKIRSWLFNRI